MKGSFNKQVYRKELIDAGFSPDDAETIAARTAEAQAQGRPRETFQTVGTLVNMARKAMHTAADASNGQKVEQKRPALPRPSAVERSERLAKEAAESAKSMTIAPRGTNMAKRKTATESLSKQVSEAKQAALLKHTKQQIRDMQLTLFDIAPWPDTMRAMPNDTARSALFTTRNKKTPRDALQNKVIFHVNKDVKITYTGVELRADDDELVWQQVLEYAKRTPIGEPITFTFYELCQDLGWSINGRYYTKAEQCLSRLQATAMGFTSERVGHLESVSLLHRFRVLDRGKKTSRCQVLIDEEIVVLFAGEHYTKFIWEKYRKLSPTARRMFDYFSTHREPYPLKLETFRLMCGSDSTRVKKWREQVGEACGELHESGLVETAWVNNDLVHCKR
ncbi:transcriptional regulator [Xanthomonas vasicola]|uniref:Plasmid replication initiator TrfA n=1 Tax=Xanthomonas hortorum pv. vitians TaxID=83224 RepID=A0AAW8ZQM6_9XANT|nr:MULTISPECIES: plasmid replication initiator TrfA [Xanthomonas]KGR62610.1 transcriptional regulator [Xanthomonas vasicola]MDV7248898.1 plasmid replication initiator TrfA [Xanthomonas hortorum pv. vitians]